MDAKLGINFAKKSKVIRKLQTRNIITDKFGGLLTSPRPLDI